MLSMVCRLAVTPVPLLALALAGCAPALDWRDVRPQGSSVALQLPCRPASHERSVPLAGAPVALALYACSAGGQTWGLAFADLGDPARVSVALEELRTTAAANIGAAGAPQALPLQVRGATPNPASVRLRLDGHAPDGAARQMQLAVFAHGTVVFQASVLGERVADEAADNFFASIRFDR